MKTKITLHIYAKGTKSNAAGHFPIYFRLTVDGKRLEFSTKKFVDPVKWSQELSKMKGNSEEACSLNEYLELMKSKIFDIQRELIYKKQALNIVIFKNKLLGIEERQRTIIPIFQDHYDKIKELVGKEYAPGTLERYSTSLKHTKDFLEWKYKATDIEITKIDHAFITDYEFYLRSVRNCNNNTAVKYIKNFRKIIKLCLANHWLDRDNNIFITSLLSKSDGHFSFIGLRPGNYSAALDRTQLEYLNMGSNIDSSRFTIGIDSDGDVAKQIKFILYPKASNSK